MKKKTLAGLCVLSLSAALFSCQNSASQREAEQKAEAEQQKAKADSIAKAQAEQQMRDSLRTIELL